MSIVRQMPRLIVRGSLAQVTMTGLSSSDMQKIDTITREVINHPELQKSRQSFIRKLSHTIKSDYRDDLRAADAEYGIAIWRAVVSLVHHNTYVFKCQSCGCDRYLTKRQKPKLIDRVQMPCPNCRKCKVTNPGTTKHQIGDYVTYDEYLDSMDRTGLVCESSIESEALDKKYANPQQILNDPEQLRKFFSEFIWNYFRQQLNENRRESKNVTKNVCGRADHIIISEILSLCADNKMEFSHPDIGDVHFTKYRIDVKSLLAPPEFSVYLSKILQRAKANNILVQIDPKAITIITNINSPFISTSIVSPEYINMVDGSSCIAGSDDTQFNIDQIGERGTGMYSEDHVAQIETLDVITQIRQAIANDQCKAIFDIMAQHGDTFADFTTKFGDKRPTNDQLATFLGVSSKDIPYHRENIRTICLMHGLTPLAN